VAGGVKCSGSSDIVVSGGYMTAPADGRWTIIENTPLAVGSPQAWFVFAWLDGSSGGACISGAAKGNTCSVSTDCAPGDGSVACQPVLTVEALCLAP
jgi:hypothetical protein